MHIVVRLAAVMLASSALITLSGLMIVVSRLGFAHVLLFPRLMLFADAVTIVGGLIAAIQLWRFKRSGRTVGLVVFGVELFYQTVWLAILQEPGARLPGIVAVATFDLLGVIILSLPSCRRAVSTAPNFRMHPTGRSAAPSVLSRLRLWVAGQLR